MATALVAVYIEFASTIALAYTIYLIVLALRRQLVLRSMLRLLVPPIAILAVLLNTYLVKELEFVRSQATGGLANSRHASFGFALSRPRSLRSLASRRWGPEAGRRISASIVLAAILSHHRPRGGRDDPTRDRCCHSPRRLHRPWSVVVDQVG